ncbi:MAG: ATP-dependent Clp protease ATP-binding subunit ClpX [Bacteroidia bacterium]|jgi:ATP-dependent Clp protease ATP-binding subunit ClpX|nr:ATP-dependent Clp protease ATP-binding subunit ClpX [Bacteroidia bacterium]
MKAKEQLCSFCGRKKTDTLMLISGVEGHICENCVEQAFKIVEEELGASKSKKKHDTQKGTGLEDFTLPTPSQIRQHLDEYVIGQDDAKKVMCVAVYNHYKRILNINKTEDVEIEKSNILMVGETGTGKTLLARTLARFLNVPFCIADATVLTEAGYVGDDVESILARLLQVANYDASAAERGIIYLDEIDKISRKSDNASITRDVSGEGVQQGLLKILEGTIAHVAPEGGRKHPDAKYVKIDTSNILFICGGAFDGIEKIISRRVKNQEVGFKTGHHDDVEKKDLLKHISPADLKQFGLIPEIIGRLPIIAALEPLDKVVLKNILTQPKNALIKQYSKLFELEGIALSFDDAVIDFIVEKAFEFQLGARGLRGICESILLDYMYETPGKENVKKLHISLKEAEKHWEKYKTVFKAA